MVVFNIPVDKPVRFRTAQERLKARQRKDEKENQRAANNPREPLSFRLQRFANKTATVDANRIKTNKSAAWHKKGVVPLPSKAERQTQPELLSFDDKRSRTALSATNKSVKRHPRTAKAAHKVWRNEVAVAAEVKKAREREALRARKARLASLSNNLEGVRVASSSSAQQSPSQPKLLLKIEPKTKPVKPAVPERILPPVPMAGIQPALRVTGLSAEELKQALQQISIKSRT
jgi:hypothetical protein